MGNIFLTTIPLMNGTHLLEEVHEGEREAGKRLSNKHCFMGERKKKSLEYQQRRRREIKKEKSKKHNKGKHHAVIAETEVEVVRKMPAWYQLLNGS